MRYKYIVNCTHISYPNSLQEVGDSKEMMDENKKPAPKRKERLPPDNKESLDKEELFVCKTISLFRGMNSSFDVGSWALFLLYLLLHRNSIAEGKIACGSVPNMFHR